MGGGRWGCAGLRTACSRRASHEAALPQERGERGREAVSPAATATAHHIRLGAGSGEGAGHTAAMLHSMSASECTPWIEHSSYAAITLHSLQLQPPCAWPAAH